MELLNVKSDKLFYNDSKATNLNATCVAIESISSMITEEFGEKYLQNRSYKNKAAGAQEAHEAIRPTYVQNKSVSQDKDEQRLYELIWKRAISSQMSNAKLEKTLAFFFAIILSLFGSKFIFFTAVTNL